MNFVISQENAQLILNHLMTQPYGNVWGLVNILQTLEESPLKVDPKTGEKYLDMGGGARMSFGEPEKGTEEETGKPEEKPKEEPTKTEATPEKAAEA